MLRYKAKLKHKARQLRQKMTDSERILWHRLRGKQLFGVQFYRQKPIGKYIVVFMHQGRNWLLKWTGHSIWRANKLREMRTVTNIWPPLA
jgi:very-short-patch-repair endonuclease